jgi:predicted alpha/beta superfamily hydrolase
LIFQAHETKEHLLKSSVVAQVFRIKVFQPVSSADGSERFPVLYVTDSDDFFDALTALAACLQYHGETPRFIMVGIGYEEEHAAGALRVRDLYTHAIRKHSEKEMEQLAKSALVSGIDDFRKITQTTDAVQFLAFIRTELMPFIAKHYPAQSDDNNYFGYSAGGAFGLYTLFTQADTFKRYMLGSPATSYGGHNFGIELAKAFIQSSQSIEAKLFMSVGELEEFKRGLGQFDLVTGYYLLAKFLKKSAIDGLDLTLRVFPGETHATAWTLAFSHGLKTLFGPVDQVPYWPEFLR